ncbi:MAG: ribulose-phosphate 3-epimerase [Bacteroidales bacterium]|nr:ribulose-phosphate 3-epimerase [Bacteroidales bacterium]MBN2817773.1 ribulose-phosphate 3-epimerase [Bacteroidales bacterium]
MERIISPSILAADFMNLREEIELINKSSAQWLHCDVMDGVFVPNISFGLPVVSMVGKLSEKPLDVHLMTIEPQNHIADFYKAGAKNITIHYEACRHLHRTVHLIKSLGINAGISLNPHTPVHFLEEIITDVDLVLIMSVNPGFGGQKLIQNSFSKIERLKELIEKKNSNAMIQVDGGVTLENARQLFEAGVNNIVAGTTIFKSEDPKRTIELLLEA